MKLITQPALIGKSSGDPEGISEAFEREDSTTPAQLQMGPGWGQTLLAAARLKHVLGPTRKVAAVNGFESEDGGSVLAARIGSALAEIDQGEILVMDANAASPRIAELFSLRNSPGLLDVLDGQAELKDALSPVKPSNLWVLPLGAAKASVVSLFTSQCCEIVMRQLREQFRFIIVDAGLVRSAEATLFASLSDGVLISLAAGQRTREEVASFEEEHRRLQIPILGAVLTKRTSGQS
jgi:Mrp family chromosome partitioning ATPase